MPGVAPSRVALHTITTKPLSLRECVDECVRVGFGGICPWVEHIEPVGVADAARMIAESGLDVPAYVRGGFFVHDDLAQRRAAIDRCRTLLEDAHALGARNLVIVPGAQGSSTTLPDARAMVRDSLAELCPHAAQAGVRLALEPLHPMYAATRSCVNTLTQAREMCEAIDHPSLGVAVDVYHVWWDDRLDEEIRALGRQARLCAFHICDWLEDTTDLLTDRGGIGEGCIPIHAIRSLMEAAGFDGPIEVEVLSERHWNRDQRQVVDGILEACRDVV